MHWDAGGSEGSVSTPRVLGMFGALGCEGYGEFGSTGATGSTGAVLGTLREMRAGAGAAVQKCTSRVNHSQLPSLARWAHPGGEFLVWVGSTRLSCSHS